MRLRGRLRRGRLRGQRGDGGEGRRPGTGSRGGGGCDPRLFSFSRALALLLKGRLYSLSIVCGPNYPLEPPVVSFLSKVAIKCVDGAGRVDVNKVLKGRSGWGRDLDIAAVLSSIRADMVSPDNRRTPQPPEGSCY